MTPTRLAMIASATPTSALNSVPSPMPITCA
eukprot:CAMPEP_0185831312 /NCGR_PEP_ID=MMETSP1353-20130828/1417_1 /TAXON_ID=1077150 /ORGANISM="Erythrolobus australicus, Strain CCMP3124" /LENGTH=30 /DNA_ID= /DNA_START= /DNA_END= /DNA_ORIENTATION=